MSRSTDIDHGGGPGRNVHDPVGPTARPASRPGIPRLLLVGGRRAAGLSERAVTNPLVAYGLIAALQLRVLWDIWKYADLTTGDTSYYFPAAESWAHGLHEDVVYYPLYDIFWGTILAVVHNVYAATIIQRAMIVFAASLLVLAVMRALLGAALALLIAAWWAVLPPNYEVLFEVHLFGALPILLTLLVVARSPGRLGLGVATAILFASSVLVRNELILAAAILAFAALAYELREFRSGRRPRVAAYCTAYVVPLAIAGLLIGGAYARSFVQGGTAWQFLQAKEELNFCQDSATTYQQFDPSALAGNAELDCSTLMVRLFGTQGPTLLAALRANPGAVAKVFGWNAELIPSGLEVALFDATATGQDPGFGPAPREHSNRALVLALALLLVVLTAIVLSARAGTLSPRRLSSRARWVGLVLGTVAIATIAVVLTTRPWTEYMYGLTVCVLLGVGGAASALLRRAHAIALVAPVGLGMVAALILIHPSYSNPDRPIYDGYRHLQTLKPRLQSPQDVLVADNYAFYLCNYLSYEEGRTCTSLEWSSLRSQISGPTAVGRALDAAHATALYADSWMLADPLLAEFAASPRRQGWVELEHGQSSEGVWAVFVPLADGSTNTSGRAGERSPATRERAAAPITSSARSARSRSD